MLRATFSHSQNVHKAAVSLYRRMSKCYAKCVKEMGLATINWCCLYTFWTRKEEQTLNVSFYHLCCISMVWRDVTRCHPERHEIDMHIWRIRTAKLQSDITEGGFFCIYRTIRMLVLLLLIGCLWFHVLNQEGLRFVFFWKVMTFGCVHLPIMCMFMIKLRITSNAG